MGPRDASRATLGWGACAPALRGSQPAIRRRREMTPGDFVPVQLETNKVAWSGALAQPTQRAHFNPVCCPHHEWTFRRSMKVGYGMVRQYPPGRDHPGTAEVPKRADGFAAVSSCHIQT